MLQKGKSAPEAPQIVDTGCFENVRMQEQGIELLDRGQIES